jgi:putative mRNA 3-end processing factor
MRRFRDRETAFASGWMRVRGTRRRKGFDRGFALSDHADWPALLRTIEETGARRVLVTHGYADELSAYLREKGLESGVIATEFEGEADLPA